MDRHLRRRRLTAVLMLIMAMLFLSACGDDGSSGDSSGGDPIYTDSWTAPETEPEPEEPTTPTTCQTDDVCFTYPQMREVLARAFGFVEPYFEEQYETPPLVDNFWYVYGEDGGVSECGAVTTDDAFYCPVENAIYLGQEFLWLIYSKVAGDAGVALVVAHEYGHHLQNRFGVPPPATARETIPHENQADCVAGAWAAWADEKGYFTAGDAEELLYTLDYVGSAEGPERDHGTDSERLEALLLGLEGGLDACNDFYSATPLITR